MQILFVDESGTPPPPGKAADTPFFVLGAIVVPEDVWRQLADDLKRLKDHAGVTGEIKWRYFAPTKPGGKRNSLSHLGSAAKETVRSKLYELVGKYKSIKLISVCTNVALAYQLNYVNDADDLYWYSYKQLTERFQYYLQDLERIVGNRVNGIIVCDHRAPKDDARLRELHQKLIEGKRANFSSYPNLIEGLFIAPSHLSVGVQLADMCAGAVFRAVAKKDARFFSQIEPCFRRSPSGKLEGYGLVKFPPRGW